MNTQLKSQPKHDHGESADLKTAAKNLQVCRPDHPLLTAHGIPAYRGVKASGDDIAVLLISLGEVVGIYLYYRHGGSGWFQQRRAAEVAGLTFNIGAPEPSLIIVVESYLEGARLFAEHEQKAKLMVACTLESSNEAPAIQSLNRNFPKAEIQDRTGSVLARSWTQPEGERPAANDPEKCDLLDLQPSEPVVQQVDVLPDPIGRRLNKTQVQAKSRGPAVHEAIQNRPATFKDNDEPDHHRNAPRPDPEALYGLLGEIAKAAAEGTEANPYAVMLNAIVLASVGVGRGPFLPIANTWHHANILALHVGRSGKGRKGDAASAINRIERALQQAHGVLAPQVHRGGLSTREGLAFLIHDGYTDGKNEVEPIHDKRLMVMESEFANVLAQSRRDGNTLSTALRDVFDGADIKPATKNNRVSASNPHVGLIGAITPTELRACIATRELTNGFANRFLMIWAERTGMVAFPEPMPQELVNSFAKRLSETFRFAGADRPADRDLKQMTYSTPARALFESLYNARLNDQLGGPALAPLLERRAPVLLRLAMIFALTDLKLVIDVQHINAAFAWIKYWEQSVLYVFASASDEEAAQEVSEAANKIVDFLQTKDEASRWDINRICFGGHLPKVKIDAALDELLGASPPLIEVESRPNPGGRGASAVIKFYKLPAKLARLRGWQETRRKQGIELRNDPRSSKIMRSPETAAGSAPSSQFTSTSQQSAESQHQLPAGFSPTPPTSPTSHDQEENGEREDDSEDI